MVIPLLPILRTKCSTPVLVYTICEFKRALFGTDAIISPDETAEPFVSIIPLLSTLQWIKYLSMGRKSTTNGETILVELVVRLPTKPIL